MMARSSMAHPVAIKLSACGAVVTRADAVVSSCRLSSLALPLALAGDACGLAQEGLKALAPLRLAGEIAGRLERLGTLLRCKQALQAERLLDAERGQFIAGLRHL